MTSTVLVSIIGALQWLGGIALAIAATRRSRRFARAGAPPRLFARAALFVFGVAAIVLLLSLAHGAASVFPPEFATRSWRIEAVAETCIVGWLLLSISAFWNTVLGVSLRRRIAAAELKRRTARVFDHRTPGGA